jgi:hypothetical protein
MEPLDDLEENWQDELKAFKEARQPYLLYEWYKQCRETRIGIGISDSGLRNKGNGDEPVKGLNPMLPTAGAPFEESEKSFPSIGFQINNFTALSVKILDNVPPVRLTRIFPSGLVKLIIWKPITRRKHKISSR